MANAITVPRLGWSMEEGTFVEWRKQAGDMISVGDPLFVLESDKSTEVIEAIDAGVLRFTEETPAPGTVVKVGQVLGYLGETSVEFPSLKIVNVSAARKTISPRARRVAKEMGVDWSTIQGTGRTGRIRERDVRAIAPQTPTDRVIPHTPLRKTLAARMVAAVTEAAPVTLTTRVDATNLVNLREQFKAGASPNDVIPGYTDLLLKLTAVALAKHPHMQSQWRDTGLYQPGQMDLAFAVDTEAGLLAPVIRRMDTLTIYQVAEQSRELICQARQGQLRAEQMREATFTISNLGTYGIDAFTPLLNLPQSGILGVGQIRREAMVIKETVVPRDVLTLSLTFDHRVVDGAPAGRFLAELKRMIEHPAPQLIPRGPA